MLKEPERIVLDRVITSEEAGHWAGDVERGREVLDQIASNFPTGEPCEEATADLIGCLLEILDRQTSVIDAMGEVVHRRRCRGCGIEAFHADNVIPYVTCRRCGSNDTRPIKGATAALNLTTPTSPTPRAARAATE